MNRAEFMRRLTELLGDVAPTEREEAIQYYNDYFDDAGEENESGVIASLGTPEELARTIKAGLNDGGNSGEFTESGFSGYTQAPKDEIVKVQDGEAADRTDTGAGQAGAAYSESAGCEGAQGSGEFRGTQSGNGYYEGAYYKRPEGDGMYGGRQDTRNYRNPYEESGSRESSAGRTYGQNTSYEQSGSYGTGTSYEQSGSYGTGTSYGQGKAAKEPMSGGMIALIVVLAVLTSPVWIGLLGGFLGVAASLIAVLFALFLTFLIIGVVFIVVAIALLVTGVTLLFSAPLAALCVIGCGLVLFALGLVGIWVMVALAGLAIPAFVRGIVSLCQKIFRRGGARA
ncbi:MAG: hypothetical protein K2P22_10630 [Lachnospiraceae bacterium]|nr:hypothetical protein [Lachnospiraceae bacterium]